MKLVTFSHKQHSRLGAVIGDQIIDMDLPYAGYEINQFTDKAPSWFLWQSG